MTRSKNIYSPRGSSDLERFYRKVEEDPETGCHNWMGGKSKWGHGYFNERRVDGTFKTVLAHRWIFKTEVAPIKAGEPICHRCNNPSCVNPDHLYQGTFASNVADAIAIGTHISTRPEKHQRAGNGNAKLTERQVSEIRASGERSAVLAERYGVSRSHIRLIVRGVSWPIT